MPGFNELESGRATSGSGTSISDTSKNWAANIWRGDNVVIIAGAGVGQQRVITGNSSDGITVASWTTNPDNTSRYAVYAAGPGPHLYIEAVTVDVNEGISADVEPAVSAVSGLRLIGWAMRESDGTPAVATIRLMNGATVSAGTGIITVELAANESKNAWYGPEGIDSENGITIDRIAGTVDVYIYHKTLV